MSKTYPRNSPGRFRSLRNVLSVMLQALLFITPWLQWGGRQAILMDVPGRKLHVLGWTFWPQETYFLLLILVSAALTLFFVTSLFGRVWCGYACPQTLFSQSFIMVERFIEGDAYKRIRLDNGPWNAEKLSKKVAKWSIWLGMSAFLGLTFAGYYTPIRPLAADLISGHAQPGTLAVIGFFTLVSLAFFGNFRGRFCTTMCPYARFQGSMFDRDSLIVGYDYNRGEPRGKAKDPESGSCVDCTMCVQVCPMGIDIREGQQFECITCAACVDACDSVMEKLGREGGLIRYCSQNELEGQSTQVVRTRPMVYAGLLAALFALSTFLLLNRSLVTLDVVRDGAAGPYTQTADGRVANLYNLRVINKQGPSRTFRLEVEGLPQAELLTNRNPVTVDGESSETIKVFVAVDPEEVGRITPIRFRLTQVDESERTIERKTTFLTGAR